MKAHLSTPQIVILFVVLAFLLPSVALAKTRPEINHQLRSAIARVRRAKTLPEKLDAAERLVALTDERDCSAVTDETIHSLASLLDIEDDGVRMWVAGALGDIGPRASEAVPKLLSILSVSACTVADRGSLATIPKALTKMGVTPPAINCQR